MLFLDFTKIRKTLPKHKPVWLALQDWTKQHPQVEAVPVVELMFDLRDKVGASDLLEAINKLIAHGNARKTYRVVDPSMKVLLSDEYQKRTDVPERVLNDWNQWIDIKPHDVAMVLQAAR